MIDDNHYPGIRHPINGVRFGAGSLEKFSQARHFVNPEILRVGTLEELAVSADHEGDLLAAVRLDMSQMFNELYRVVPVHASRQFALQQILAKHGQLMMEMLAHVHSLLGLDGEARASTEIIIRSAREARKAHSRRPRLSDTKC
jgi:hypothetical protein